MSLPQLRLENQLCFRFHRISRELTAAYRPLLADLGLTYPQYLAMLVLWERDGRTVGEIGEHLALDSGTLSPLIRRLETGGLVTRRRSADDERKVGVYLTVAGRKLEGRAADVPQALAQLLARDPGEYEQAKAALDDLIERLTEARRRAETLAGGAERT